MAIHTTQFHGVPFPYIAIVISKLEKRSSHALPTTACPGWASTLCSAPLRLSLLPMPSSVPAGVQLIRVLQAEPHAQALETWGTLALTAPTEWHAGFLPNLKGSYQAYSKRSPPIKGWPMKVIFCLGEFARSKQFQAGCMRGYMHETQDCVAAPIDYGPGRGLDAGATWELGPGVLSTLSDHDWEHVHSLWQNQCD